MSSGLLLEEERVVVEHGEWVVWGKACSPKGRDISDEEGQVWSPCETRAGRAPRSQRLS